MVDISKRLEQDESEEVILRDEFRAELQARRQIVAEWMKDVDYPIGSDSETQRDMHGVLKRRLALLAVYADLNELQPTPTVWGTIERCIPEGERKAFPDSARKALASPLSGDPLAILTKTQLVQRGYPVDTAFDGLRDRIIRDVQLNRIHALLYPLDNFS